MKQETISATANRRAFPILRALALGTALVSLAACDENFNLDLGPRGLGGSGGARAVTQTTEPRPAADNRGVISYPNYQVAVARRGDTVADVAARVGLSAAELSSFNGISADVPLRQGEIIALPRRISEPSPATGAISTGPIRPNDQIDITTLAGNAIDRAQPVPPTGGAKAGSGSGLEPIRHKVERGETAYSISRLYNVSVRALAQWNGLGPDLSVREGQYLLIPVAAEDRGAPLDTAAPGVGSTPPPPPSAAKPLPRHNVTDAAPKATPPSPNLGSQRTAASGTARLLFPVQGKIIRAYVKKKNDGIDIASPAGTPVKAADAGTVAAITQDTDQVPILVLRHGGNLLTVYANIDAITVKKGDKVKRGQKIAVVRKGTPSFLHFEVRQGFDSVDPMPFLN